ncbi:MAG: restriction endonuclease [Candidatus Aenigmatarchaeota archaeon]
MLDLEKIKQQLEKESLEDALERYNWEDFEKFVAEIFRYNGFEVRENLRFKTKRRYEIDIFAKRFDLIFCIDCKRWKKGRYKKSGLKRAAKLQEERILQFKKFLTRNPIARNILKIKKIKIIPLIITLFEEDLIKVNNTLFVPLWKLNSFLQEVELYI